MIFGFQENLLYKERIRKQLNTLENQFMPISTTTIPDRKDLITFTERE